MSAPTWMTKHPCIALALWPLTVPLRVADAGLELVLRALHRATR